jgi:hypothetical protein
MYAHTNYKWKVTVVALLLPIFGGKLIHSKIIKIFKHQNIKKLQELTENYATGNSILQVFKATTSVLFMDTKLK